jgi:hypothetical protein
MEYVVVSTTQLTYLTLQLPGDLARLIQFAPLAGDTTGTSRSVTFLNRGPGVARVVATYPTREALAVETYRNRVVATARLSDGLLFSLPSALAAHLGLTMVTRPQGTRGTDDALLWFLRADEYYAYRQGPRTPRPPAPAHVYVTKSWLPLPKELAVLGDLEGRIEHEEWRPGVEALQKVAKGRRGPSAA